LDPFLGSGTTGAAAEALGRKWVGIEKNPEYGEISERRLKAIRAVPEVHLDKRFANLT
jgi:modification methylase